MQISALSSAVVGMHRATALANTSAEQVAAATTVTTSSDPPLAAAALDRDPEPAGRA